ISVEDGVTVWTCLGQCFAELLHNPLGARVPSDVEVQDLSTPMLDDEETVQHLERDRRDGEEVECEDCLAMILEKRQPALGWITSAANSPQITGYRPFRGDEAEFLKFSVDLRRSPIRVLLSETLDQGANLGRDFGPTTAGSRAPAPPE